VDLEFFSRFTAILAYLSGATARVGFDNFHAEGLYRGRLSTHRVIYNPLLHTARAFVGLVEALDQDPAERPLPKLRADWAIEAPRLARDTTTETRMREKLERCGSGSLESQRVFLLNPNASALAPIRKWPLDRYIALANALLQDRRNLVVVIGKEPKTRSTGVQSRGRWVPIGVST
jgi:ADP-heptose:LPS heptosyltransferase